MQLFCNKHFDWLDVQKLRHTNQRYPVANSKRAESRKYISLHLHTDLFSQFGLRQDIKNRVEFKENI